MTTEAKATPVPEVPEAKATEAPKPPKTVTVTADVLLIHAAPALDSPAVSRVAKGTQLIVLEQKEGWIKTTKGYVNATHVK
jgi:hypothetical protein